MTDYLLLVQLWNSGPQGKTQALAMADADRKQSALKALNIDTGATKK